MFDKLDDLLVRFEELLNELGEPGVTDDPAHFQKLMKEPVSYTHLTLPTKRIV